MVHQRTPVRVWQATRRTPSLWQVAVSLLIKLAAGNKLGRWCVPQGTALIGHDNMSAAAIRCVVCKRFRENHAR